MFLESRSLAIIFQHIKKVLTVWFAVFSFTSLQKNDKMTSLYVTFMSDSLSIFPLPRFRIKDSKSKVPGFKPKTVYSVL